MEALLFIKNYFIWHYLWALRDLFHVWLLMVKFVLNYFSVPLLIKTLFRPWKRMGEARRGMFDFEFILIDILMRLVGFVLRTVTIFMGLVATFFSVIVGPFLFIFWLIIPLLIIFLFLYGVKLFF